MNELQRKQIAALRESRWISPAESCEPCTFPIGKAGAVCLRCDEDHVERDKRQSKIRERSR